MKILIVSFYYPPEIGAASSRIYNMVAGLKELGNEVEVLTCLPNYPKGEIFDDYKGRIYKKDIINDSNVYRYWTYATVSKNPLLRGISMMSFAFVLWLFAFRFKLIKSYDRVIIQSPPLPVASSAICLFKGLFGKTVILNVSDLWPLSAVELGAMRDGSLIHKIFSKLEKFNYKKADVILGQSNEIIAHISRFETQAKLFTYRNLQRYELDIEYRERNSKLKIVYAGLLGVAQDILGIIKNIDFKSLNVEFHIYGGGNQAKNIEEYIRDNKCNVYYHGYVSKEDISNELSGYDASIIPLAVNIKGAVPSKIYDTMPLGIPILFCGGGEGASIIKEYNLGLVSEPGDYRELQDNISKLTALSSSEYIDLSRRCVQISKEQFNFTEQINTLNINLRQI